MQINKNNKEFFDAIKIFGSRLMRYLKTDRLSSKKSKRRSYPEIVLFPKHIIVVAADGHLAIL